MLHDEGHIEELEVSWFTPSGRPRWAKLSWEYDFSNDIRQALQDLIRCGSLKTLHLESIHDIPAAETFNLSTLKELSLHNVVVDARDKLLGQGPTTPSNLEIIQVSGNGASLFMQWLRTHYQTPNLKRISISIPLQPDDTIPGLDELAAVNRPIIDNWENLEQIDIYSNRADSLDPGFADLNLSRHLKLKILAKRIDYYCDTDYAHLPPPSPSLVNLVSTIDPESTVQIRLTLYAHFLSLSSFGSLTGIDLTPLADVLEGKRGVSLHIWVCSNWPMRTAAIKALLERQLGNLQGQGRLRVQTTDVIGDARFWEFNLL
ncbi:hypothetical protein EST38_g6093 [Candolleomyces aberdarensis]|uniref:Uncharacterized protein n=1 Tax=Candolleomyces aberdarensis TaxID=2316362 RepID=A0A4Q2DKM1_9AGAR|nr:hypothetical protein EST38_g6093 [Candolleomyces aberdarensis]